MAAAVAAMGGASPQAAMAQDGGLRPYFQLHFGRAWYTDTDIAPGVGLKSPSDEQVTGGAIGFDYGRHLSLEAVVDFVETQLLNARGTDHIAEYAMWTAMAQARLRYPLMNDRLVPYLLLGLGWGSGELNDRNQDHVGVLVDGSRSSSFVGAFGAGLEYFLTDHIAFGIEGKRLFAFEPEIAVDRQPADIDLDSYYVTGGFRVYFDRIGGGAAAPAATGARTDAGRWYVGLRGGSVLLPDSDAIGGVELASPTGFAFGASLGYNIDRHWGVELGGEYAETDISEAGLGITTEYSFWTFLALLRYRYPLLEGRLVPYAIAGAGVGLGEFSDSAAAPGVSAFSGERERDMQFVGAVGMGADWFVTDKIAFTAELKHIRPFEMDATVNGRAGEIKLNPVSLMVGVRVFWD